VLNAQLAKPIPDEMIIAWHHHMAQLLAAMRLDS